MCAALPIGPQVSGSELAVSENLIRPLLFFLRELRVDRAAVDQERCFGRLLVFLQMPKTNQSCINTGLRLGPSSVPGDRQGPPRARGGRPRRRRSRSRMRG